MKTRQEIPQRKKITHIITGLNGGGAEAMLFKLLENSNREKFDIQVISMLDCGVYGDQIERELSIQVFTLNMKKGVSSISAVYKCLKLCSETDIIQGWMYHANLFSFLVGKLLNKKVIWGIHHSDLSKDKNKFSTVVIAKLCGKLSRFVDTVVSCGEIVRKVHMEIGYFESNNKVIPNGFDINNFSPAKQTVNVRQDLMIDEGKKIIIHVARWDPLKDHENLIQSIRQLKSKRKDFEVLLVGKDIDYNNEVLTSLVKQNGVENIVNLLGRREDVPVLMASADLFVSSSSGEGFPNVIGEAMASGTYCVVTDTGDCSNMVGEHGLVVPPQDSKALADALNLALDMSKNQYDKEVILARRRVIEKFDIINVTKEYEKLYN